ncbi:ankyrin repeat domain-containing protein [Pseudonocardia parietis]|uniref:Ankyrin repeat protein n=1 Tax=Pseudonocardia parietis TaxID=570936 RepID=A0ABS4VQV1_9PSEU|nr:ankyrin repeat domain-containing protein [Pseudonocardia parietis]MBP2366289.1 ankyrin repeat protein [Pseudonocardia parietis]
MDDAAVELAHRMFDLARDGATEQLVAYLDAGVPVEITDPKGDTLLILAAYYGSGAIVADLLRRGADPNRTNDRGQTAIAAALFAQSSDSVTALLEAGADPHHGSPSAWATVEHFDLPDMRVLLEQRIDT